MDITCSSDLYILDYITPFHQVEEYSYSAVSLFFWISIFNIMLLACYTSLRVGFKWTIHSDTSVFQLFLVYIAGYSWLLSCILEFQFYPLYTCQKGMIVCIVTRFWLMHTLGAVPLLAAITSYEDQLYRLLILVRKPFNEALRTLILMIPLIFISIIMIVYLNYNEGSYLSNQDVIKTSCVRERFLPNIVQVLITLGYIVMQLAKIYWLFPFKSGYRQITITSFFLVMFLVVYVGQQLFWIVGYGKQVGMVVFVGILVLWTAYLGVSVGLALIDINEFHSIKKMNKSSQFAKQVVTNAKGNKKN